MKPIQYEHDYAAPAISLDRAIRDMNDALLHDDKEAALTMALVASYHLREVYVRIRIQQAMEES